MTTTNDWIKRSDREVTAADCPVWYVQQLGSAEEVRLSFSATYIHGYDSITHWRSAKADIPAPPKEQTQRERDAEAYLEWYMSPSAAAVSSASRHCWHAALAWERAEIAKILGDISPMTWLGNPSYFVPKENMERLRARLRP